MSILDKVKSYPVNSLSAEEHKTFIGVTEYKFNLAVYGSIIRSKSKEERNEDDLTDLKVRWYLVNGLLETDYIVMAPILYARKQARIKLLVETAKDNARREKKKNRKGKSV